MARWAPRPQTQRKQPGTGLGKDQMSEEVTKAASSVFCLALAHAFSRKLSIPKSGTHSPSPSLCEASRPGVLGKCREPSKVIRLCGNRTTCSEQETKSSCVHQVETERGGPGDTHPCKCDLAAAELGPKATFGKSLSKPRAQSAFPHLGYTK